MTEEGEDRQSHDFIVIGVERADVEGSIGVTLTDARGGRVTLHLDRDTASALRDLLDDQLP